MAVRVKIEGVDREIKRLLRWVDVETKDATQVFKGYAAEHLAVLIRNSPQSSGDFAANWNYSLNTPDTSFEEGRVPPSVDKGEYQQFDPQAIAIGLLHNLGKDAHIKLGDTVYFTNTATHTNHKGIPDPYYQKILDGTMNLRDVNKKVTLTAAMQKFRSKYPRVLKGNQRGALKRKSAGHHMS